MTLLYLFVELSCQSETGFVFKKDIYILLLDVFVFLLLSTKCLLLLLFCSMPTHMSLQILQMGIPISVMTIVQAFSQHPSNSTSTWSEHLPLTAEKWPVH